VRNQVKKKFILSKQRRKNTGHWGRKKGCPRTGGGELTSCCKGKEIGGWGGERDEGRLERGTTGGGRPRFSQGKKARKKRGQVARKD